MEISAKVSQALAGIVTQVRQVDDLVAEVAGASREQTQGITQINTAVNQMDKVTQSSAANAEESAAAAEELNAQAEAMKDAVNELLRLVDGQGRQAGTPTSRATASRNNGVKHSSVKPPKTTNATQGNGHCGLPKPANGRAQLVPAAGDRRSGIPLESPFRDF